MSVKDVTDAQVVQAAIDAKSMNFEKWPYDLLMERTGQPFKVCYRAMERACDRDLIEFGVSLRTGWPTPKGLALVGEGHKQFNSEG